MSVWDQGDRSTPLRLSVPDGRPGAEAEFLFALAPGKGLLLCYEDGPGLWQAVVLR